MHFEVPIQKNKHGRKLPLSYICVMNKNLIYLLILLGLGFLTYYFVFLDKTERYDTNEANFTVRDTADITIILMTNQKGDKIKFSRKKNSEWILNDSMEVIQQKVKDLMEAMHDQQPLQPVRLGSHDEVIRNMSANNTKVEIFTKKGNTHTFYVSKITAPNNLTYMLTEGAERPYIVKLPLQNIFLGLKYSTDLKDWRSRKIMHAKADDIEMIDVTYKDSLQYSFQLINEKGKTPVLTGNQISSNPLNINRVYSYLRLWDSLYCLGFEDRNRIKDTILNNGRELATVSMKSIGKPLQTLKLFFKPITKGTKGVLKVGNEEYDFDVFIGFLNNRDMIVMTRNFAQIMLRSYPEFFEAEPAQIEPKR